MCHTPQRLQTYETGCGYGYAHALANTRVKCQDIQHNTDTRRTKTQVVGVSAGLHEHSLVLVCFVALWVLIVPYFPLDHLFTDHKQHRYLLEGVEYSAR